MLVNVHNSLVNLDPVGSISQADVNVQKGEEPRRFGVNVVA